MYPTHLQASSYTEKSYYSVSPMNSIPNNPLNYHSDFSYSHPPLSNITSYPNSISSTDPYAVAPYDGQSSAYYHDLTPVSSNWVVKEAAPVKYSPAVQAARKAAIASTSYDTSLMSIRALTNSVGYTPTRKIKLSKAIPKKINAAQKVRCDLCKIECSSIQLYEKHLSGKKHNKTVQKTYSSGTTSKFVPATQPNGEHGTSSRVPSAPVDLETKKLKLMESGVAVHSVKICTVCKVACNGEVAFADHLAGKKHMAQVRSLCSMANSNSNSVSNPAPKSRESVTKTKNGGPAWCEVCKISCTNNDGLITHRLGKKHKKNLEQLKKSTLPSAPNNVSPSSTDLPTDVPQDTETTNATMPEGQESKKKGRTKEPEDMETKRRKVLECGAPADSVKTCTICNVVCNSETVFKSHLSGQKHAAMVKQAEAKSETDVSLQHV